VTATVAVGWCHPIDVAAGFAESLVEMHVHDAAGPQHIVARLPQFSSANVSWARNQIVMRFLALESGPDYLLMVDSDMILPPSVVSDLLAHADPVESPIVGALCFVLDEYGQMWPTIYQLAEHPDLGPRMIRLDDYDPDTLTTVVATGAACLLIHRTVLEAVVAAEVAKGNTAFPAFEELALGRDGAKTYPCGEDITFCLRALAVGFPTKVATGVEVGHLKAYTLTAALHREQQRRSA
jgi:GT2 family glycosyltransferase